MPNQTSPSDSFFAEVKRRRVLKALGIYIVAGWVAIQVAATVFPVFGFAEWTTRAVVIAVVIGFPVAFVISWFFDITSSGLRRTARATPRSARILAALVFTALVIGAGAFGTIELDHLWHATRLEAGKVTHVTTSPGLELDPALSPDGRTLAYAAGIPGEMRIYVRDVSGGRAIAVAEGLQQHQRAPRWSPDGNQLLFQAGGRELASSADQRSDVDIVLYSVSPLGGTPRRMLARAGAMSAAWSPDGKQFAFAQGTGIYASSIWIASTSDPEHARRMASGTDLYSLSWSPDGKLLAFVSGNVRFVFGTGHLGNDGPSTLWILNIATGALHRLSSGETLDISPVWLPDSRGLLFISNRDGARDIYRMSIDRHGEASDSAQRITTGLSAHTISLSADGRTLAYSQFTNYSHIWAAPLSASGEASLAQARQITFGNEVVEGIALSPDGKWLAYDSNRSGNGDIWKISTAGGTPQQLTTNSTGDYVQDFSPDGKEIAYHSVRDGVRHVFVMNSDGTAPQQITSSNAQEVNPDFSSDGNALIYDSWGKQPLGIWRVSRHARGEAWGSPVQLQPAGTDPSCSPDGQWIAYINSGALHVMRSNGSDTRTLVAYSEALKLPEPEFAYWSSDSRTIYYKAYDDEYRSSIWSVPLSGGSPRRLMSFNDLARPSQRREFATDGKTLYFTIAEPESDIWTMSLESKR